MPMDPARTSERQATDEPERRPETVAAAPEAGLTSPASVVALQRSAGNAAVADLLSADGAADGAAAANGAAANGGAAAAGGAPPQAPGGAPGAAGANGADPQAKNGAAAATEVPRDPKQDPRFQAMQGRTERAGQGAKTHQPPQAGAAAAQAAAEPPGNDAASQAAAAQVDEMGEQQPGTFDRKAFIDAVRKAIEAAAPKNLEEAADFKGSGKAAKVKDQVAGQVKDGKKGAEKDIKTATEAAPDTGKAKPKPVTPMQPDEPGRPAADVDAAGAMPQPRPAAATDLSKGPADVDAQMAGAEITEEQLAKSNEPDFAGALAARKEAEQHSAEAPAGYRKDEQARLGKAEGEAEAAASPRLEGMHGARVEAFAKAVGAKQGAKSKDEKQRAKVATDVEAIYTRTKTDVTGILDALDGKVDSAFSKGEQAARGDFERYVGERMDAYKEDRYSGLIGKGRWLKDKLLGMPDAVNRFYEEGKTAYLKAMDGVIGEVADVVGTELGAARTRIAKGRTEVRTYVAKLPQDLRQVGKDAEKDLGDRFDELGRDVDGKQDELVDAVAQKYVKARDDLDARIDELKAANRGLVDKAIDAIGGVIRTILQLKDMLLGVLGKAAGVIGDIIADPIGFLSNLVDGVKAGLSGFLSRIGTHLQNALMNWLLGALGGAGLKLPEKLDLAGIFDLVMQVIGLTYDNIRKRVAKIVGEPAVARMEKTAGVFQTLATQGISGLWNFVKDQLANLEDLVLGQIKEFLVEKVIKAGITWIMALMNPAGAFIRACKAIYDIVMWVVERGAQLMEFVNSVLDSIGAIAKGNLGAVASKVEDALAKALPLAISFLASLLGLGGISEKVRGIIDTVRKPINKAVDFVVLKAVKGFKRLVGGAKDTFRRGKQWAKDKAGALKDRMTGRPDPADPQQAAEPGEGEEAPDAAAVKREAGAEVRRRVTRPLETFEELQAIVGGVLGDLRAKGLKALRAVPKQGEEGKYDILATASPTEKVGEAEAGDTDPLSDDEKAEIRTIPGFPRGAAPWVSPDAEVRSGAGEEFLAEYEKLGPAKRESAAHEAKIALAQRANGATVLAIGMELMRFEGKGKARVLGTTKLTEIDVETADEIIQVKGGDYSAKTKLEKGDMRQMTETKRYNEQMRIGPDGTKLPPKRVVFQFTQTPVNPELIEWLESKGVTARTGTGAT